MPSLSDKLRSLGVEARKPKRQPESDWPIERVVSGQFKETTHGPAFVAEQRHPIDLWHGCASLHIDASLQIISEWAREPRLSQLGTETFAFLDIETTGLAWGTGTYAFLVGAGRYDGDTFQLAQFFLRDPAEEPALLAALWTFLAPSQVLVTFNGKTFDLPVLRTRCIANSQDFPLATHPHLDLLPLARRLWRDRLKSRALGCLEDEILGLPRTEEDVPGWMIPELYFDYLDDRDTRPLKGVFYHNAIDILSMAALLSHIAGLLSDPLGHSVPALDDVDMGKLFEDLGHVDLAAQLYQRALSHNLPKDVHQQAVRRWSFIEKRRDNLSAAIKLWQDAAKDGQIYAHVELAKVYEHRTRNFEGALFWTQLALDRIAVPDCPPAKRLRWEDALAHRLSRLKGKLDRVNTSRTLERRQQE